jgi:AAA15 family ATPase/GTPase
MNDNEKISQQRLHQLEIEKLKNIKDLCISFEEKNITAILAPNGHGKSTIIHALACCFKPHSENGENYIFSNFFLPNPHALWQGSELKIIHTYRQGASEHKNIEQLYSKKDRWTIYARRPPRNIHYFGVDSCVPLIETKKRKIKINYSTNQVNDSIALEILKQASYCLNKKYSAYNLHISGKSEKFIGVKSGEITYSALSMSAGEQKIFALLEKIYRAEKYSLVLIDELDLLLHNSAVNKLIEVIDQRAAEKNLQVIFTTHRESILEMSHLINIRHILETPEKTLCFNETKPDAINRLTGTQSRSIEVFVEDDLAKVIVKKIASQLGISKYISIELFGAAINCFTTLAGLLLCNKYHEKIIFVLDGDRYKMPQEQEQKLKAVLTGNDSKAKSLREQATDKIKSLQLPDNYSPEQYIHSIVSNLDIDSSDDERREIIIAAKNIHAVDDNHNYIDKIIEEFDWDRTVGLSKIIDLFSSTSEWQGFTADVKEWLETKVPEVKET